MPLEPKVRHIIDNMENAVVVHASGVSIALNKGVPALLGRPAEKILWRRLSKFIDPLSLPRLTRWIESGDRSAILVNGIRAGGRLIQLQLATLATLAYAGGRCVKIISLIEFAAKERLAQDSLSASNCRG